MYEQIDVLYHNASLHSSAAEPLYSLVIRSILASSKLTRVADRSCNAGKPVCRRLLLV